MAKFTDEDPESDPAGSEDFIFEPLDYSVYINAACNVLDAINQYEPLTKDNQLKKARILRKCLKMIDYSVEELYKELFHEEEEEEN
jgi:hypothetical protein